MRTVILIYCDASFKNKLFLRHLDQRNSASPLPTLFAVFLRAKSQFATFNLMSFPKKDYDDSIKEAFMLQSSIIYGRCAKQFDQLAHLIKTNNRINLYIRPPKLLFHIHVIMPASPRIYCQRQLPPPVSLVESPPLNSDPEGSTRATDGRDRLMFEHLFPKEQNHAQ